MASCSYSEIVRCDEQEQAPPPPREEGPPKKSLRRPAAPAGQWALLQHAQAANRPLERGEIVVVASSSPSFGEHAATEVLEEVNAQLSARERAKSGAQLSEPPIPPEERLPRLYVARGSGHCVKFSASLLSRVFPLEIERATGAYIRGITDGTGKVVSLDILYTRTPDLDAAVTSFALDNLRVWSPEAAGMPLEFYGAIHIGASQQAGYLIGGVFAPAEFERLSR